MPCALFFSLALSSLVPCTRSSPSLLPPLFTQFFTPLFTPLGSPGISRPSLPSERTLTRSHPAEVGMRKISTLGHIVTYRWSMWSPSSYPVGGLYCGSWSVKSVWFSLRSSAPRRTRRTSGRLPRRRFGHTRPNARKGPRS